MNQNSSHQNPYIERQKRARNRTWLTFRVIFMSIVIGGAAWVGFWMWLGQDSDVAVFLGEWAVLAVILVALVFGVAVLTVAVQKLYKLARPRKDSLADLMTAKSATDDSEKENR